MSNIDMHTAEQDTITAECEARHASQSGFEGRGTMNLALFHKGTIKAGQADFIGKDSLSRVRHDGSTFYYDLTDLDVSIEDFLSFVSLARDVDDESVTCSVWDKTSNSFLADVCQ